MGTLSDNKIYIHLKDNLKKQHENKCYKTYGYIKNIYKSDNKTKITSFFNAKKTL